MFGFQGAIDLTGYFKKGGIVGGQVAIGGLNANDTFVIQANSAAAGNTAGNDAVIVKTGNSGGTIASKWLQNGQFNCLAGFKSTISGIAITHTVGGSNTLTMDANSVITATGSMTVQATGGALSFNTTSNAFITFTASNTGTSTGINFIVGNLYRFWIDNSGRWGGNNITSPTAYIHLPPGTTSSGFTSLKFESGSLVTTPASRDAGGISFVTDKLFIVITTGLVWKEITLNDQVLTSGNYPIITTNGRLMNGPTPLAGTKIYYVSDTSGGTVNRKLTFINGILTAEI